MWLIITMSLSHDSTSEDDRPVVVAVRRRLLSIEPSNSRNQLATALRTPRKKYDFDSSEDEDDIDQPPSTSAAPFFQSPALDKRDVIVISDSEEDVLSKAPKHAIVKRHSSLHSLVQSSTDGEKDKKKELAADDTPRKPVKYVLQT